MEVIEEIIRSGIEDHFDEYIDCDGDIKLWDPEEPDGWRYSSATDCADVIADSIDGRCLLVRDAEVALMELVLRRYLDEGLTAREERRASALHQRAVAALREVPIHARQ